jgi:hypothetical protein
MRESEECHSGARVSAKFGISQDNIEIPGLRLRRILE